MKQAAEFFEYANLREHVRIAKESGAPQFMWTQDPVLQEWSFCNVFREDDRTTRFFRKKVREPLREDPAVLMATIAWRWFNRIETCAQVSLDEWRCCDTDAMHAALRGTQPVVTGAYLVKTPAGMSKLEGVLSCIEAAREHWVVDMLLEDDLAGWTMEEFHVELMNLPYLGRFMAYEIVTDLRHTCLLEDAEDINTWASAGPGCMRGMGRVLNGNKETFSYGCKAHQKDVLRYMGMLLEEHRNHWDWPERPWEMREVEHTLCEYDKYCRAQEGGRLKRRYRKPA